MITLDFKLNIHVNIFRITNKRNIVCIIFKGQEKENEEGGKKEDKNHKEIKTNNNRESVTIKNIKDGRTKPVILVITKV